MRAAAVWLWLVLAQATAAADCPAMAGADPALTTHDADARLVWIEGRLARTRHRAVVWRDAWGIGIASATVFNVAMIPILGDTRSHRIDFGLGAATTVVGIVPLIFMPPRVIADSQALDAHIADPSRDRCIVLAEAERSLVADAVAQRRQRAWYVHVGNVVVNTGVTFLFGAFDHWTSGIINGAIGAVVGEALIFTQPIDQIDDLARYRRGDLGGTDARAWQLVPATIPHGAGLALTLRF